LLSLFIQLGEEVLLLLQLCDFELEALAVARELVLDQGDILDLLLETVHLIELLDAAFRDGVASHPADARPVLLCVPVSDHSRLGVPLGHGGVDRESAHPLVPKFLLEGHHFICFQTKISRSRPA